MGLDQYAMKHPANDPEETTELMYWRKHNRLQGWMEALWRSRGNTEEFNCARLYLETEDLAKLREEVEARSLPKTEGFFYGKDSYRNYEGEDGQKDLDFIAMAESSLKAGDRVFYMCWY